MSLVNRCHFPYVDMGFPVKIRPGGRIGFNIDTFPKFWLKQSKRWIEGTYVLELKAWLTILSNQHRPWRDWAISQMDCLLFGNRTLARILLDGRVSPVPSILLMNPCVTCFWCIIIIIVNLQFLVYSLPLLLPLFECLHSYFLNLSSPKLTDWSMKIVFSTMMFRLLW